MSSSEQSHIREIKEMDISEVGRSSTGQGDDAASLLNQFRITDADLELVRKFGKTIQPDLQAYVDEFYVWLTVQPYFDSFFATNSISKKLKTYRSNTGTSFSMQM